MPPQAEKVDGERDRNRGSGRGGPELAVAYRGFDRHHQTGVDGGDRGEHEQMEVGPQESRGQGRQHVVLGPLEVDPPDRDEDEQAADDDRDQWAGQSSVGERDLYRG
jgi:hypothetical protein